MEMVKTYLISKLDVALVCCNIVNNNNQHESRVLYTFLFLIFRSIITSLKNLIYLKPINWKVSNIWVWFNDQNSKPLDLQDKTSITLVIN